MSKIIYRKVRTAPGLKLTDANWNANAAYYAKAVSLETLSQRDMARHISSHGSPYTVDVVMGVLEAYRNCLIEQLLESKKVKDLDVATKVSLQLQLTDPSIKSRDRVVKKSEKASLYSAIDVAAVWLERALAQG